MSPVEEREAARRHLIWIDLLGCQPEAIDEFLGLTAGVTAQVLAEQQTLSRKAG